MSEARHLGTATGKSCSDQPQGTTCSLIWLWTPSSLPSLTLITPTPPPNLVHARLLISQLATFSLYLPLAAHLKPCLSRKPFDGALLFPVMLLNSLWGQARRRMWSSRPRWHWHCYANKQGLRQLVWSISCVQALDRLSYFGKMVLNEEIYKYTQIMGVVAMRNSLFSWPGS